MTSEQQNIETVQNLLTGMEKGDVARVLFELDEDARWIGPGNELYGKAAIEAMLAHRGRMTVAGAQIHADGDQVFAEFERGAERGLAVFELTFGKVREIREYSAA